MNLQPVIGLETHVQLKTKSKMFSPADNHSEHAAPNTNISAICLGHPGVLPVPNQEAVRFAILLSLALKGDIAKESKFDRKHYFYPDLPKGYQISQFDQPIMQGGSLTFVVPGEKESTTIHLERLHLEEDAAKNIHGEDGRTYVDFNRAGSPLCEIVTKPDFRSAAAAKSYLHELRLLVRTLGISDGDMEKGQLRCDVNISLREVDKNGEPLSDLLHPKTEIKNVNSFKAVERAIEHEIQRQTKLWEMDTPPAATTTRGWDENKQRTVDQRTKEDSADYRYFPEPDIPPMNLQELTEEMSRQIPELPAAKRIRFAEEYGFKAGDVEQMIESPALAGFVEAAMSELGAWLEASPEIEADEMEEKRAKLAKLFAGWLLSKLLGVLAERKIGFEIMKINPENFAEFIILIAEGKITGASGLKVLNLMLDDGIDPSQAVEELGASKVDDIAALQELVNGIILDHPTEVERYKNGEKKLLPFFLGLVMKETQGTADPQTTARIIADTIG
ncbi:MAG: Asp-tRNA(Asn)/Glu-tRNA(Gln) amidotransferase subunit GatB [Patescibacteria group bacterium]